MGLHINLLDVLWLLTLLLLLGFFGNTKKKLQGYQKSWLMTKGRITLLQWEKQDQMTWPKIEYTYQIDDQEFVGEYLFLDTNLNTPSSSYCRRVFYNLAVAYKDNENIDVFYNPDNPQQAVLDLSVPRQLNRIILFLFFLIALHLVIVAYHLLSVDIGKVL